MKGYEHFEIHALPNGDDGQIRFISNEVRDLFDIAMWLAEELDGMRKENARLQEQLDDARDIFNEMSEDY